MLFFSFSLLGHLRLNVASAQAPVPGRQQMHYLTASGPEVLVGKALTTVPHLASLGQVKC